MDYRLKQDILRIFSIYQSRTSDLAAKLPPAARSEFAEELELLKTTVLNRLSEETDR